MLYFTEDQIMKYFLDMLFQNIVLQNIVIRNGKIVCKVVWIKYYLRLNLSSGRY